MLGNRPRIADAIGTGIERRIEVEIRIDTDARAERGVTVTVTESMTETATVTTSETENIVLAGIIVVTGTGAGTGTETEIKPAIRTTVRYEIPAWQLALEVSQRRCSVSSPKPLPTAFDHVSTVHRIVGSLIVVFSFMYEGAFIAAARQTLAVWSTNWMDD